MRNWPYQFKTEWILWKNYSVADTLLRVSTHRIMDSDTGLPILAINTQLLQYRSNFYSTGRRYSQTSIWNITSCRIVGFEKGSFYRLTAKKKQLTSLHPYSNYRDELTQENDIPFMNWNILIPRSLQQDYLNRIHSGHQGINKKSHWSKRIYILGELCKGHYGSSVKVHSVPTKLQVDKHREVQIHKWYTTTSMAYPRLWFILL